MLKVTKRNWKKKQEAKEPNEEIWIDFAGPFQNAYKQKKTYLSPYSKVRDGQKRCS